VAPSLQEVLDLEDCFDYPEYTGNFYSITLRGVKCFQEKYGIPDTGYVGPMTRAKLNELYGQEEEMVTEEAAVEETTTPELETSSLSQTVSGDLTVRGNIKAQRLYQEDHHLYINTLGSGNIILSAAQGLHFEGNQIILDSVNPSYPLIYIRDPLKIAGSITQTGSGQIIFSGNVDAKSGLDVTGGNLTVGGSNFIVDVSTGDITTAGDLTVSGDLAISGSKTLSGNETITGALTVKATTTLGDASSDKIIFNAVAGSDLNLNNYLLLNIGAAGTDFTSGGGLTLADDLDVSGTTTLATSTIGTNFYIDSSGNASTTGAFIAATTTVGKLTATSIDTGPGETEVYLMDQNVRQADAVTFGSNFVIDSSGNASTTGNLIVQGETTLATTTINNLTIGGGDRITKHISSAPSMSLTLSSPDTCTVATTSVSGALPGDSVAVGMPDTAAGLSGFSWNTWVSAADVVSLRHCTGSATTSDQALSVRIDIWQH
jgi:hypothetical protein